jgi:AcrR family transcriptional regulator
VAFVASPVRSRRRQQPDETRTLILDTAERLLRDRPFRELSVDEVMRPTGYRRTVFYRHFTGLPDLVLAVLARVLPEFAATNQAFLSAAGEDIDLDRARELLRPGVEHFQRHGALMRAMRDASVYDGDVHQLVMGAQYRFRSTTIAALERRRAAGKLQSADLEQLAELLAGMNQRYLMAVFGGDGPEEMPPATVDTATDTLALVWVAVLNTP